MFDDRPVRPLSFRAPAPTIKVISQVIKQSMNDTQKECNLILDLCVTFESAGTIIDVVGSVVLSGMRLLEIREKKAQTLQVPDKMPEVYFRCSE